MAACSWSGSEQSPTILSHNSLKWIMENGKHLHWDGQKSYKCLSLFFLLLMYLSIYLSIYQSIYLSIYQSIYLSINLSIYLSINLSMIFFWHLMYSIFPLCLPLHHLVFLYISSCVFEWLFLSSFLILSIISWTSNLIYLVTILIELFLFYF